MVKKHKSVTYVSKGQRRNVSKTTKRLRGQVSPLDKMLNIQKAVAFGKTDPWVVIENPVKHTKEQFIKVRYSEFLCHTKDPKKANRKKRSVAA